jgi:hypothetical protein
MKYIKKYINIKNIYLFYFLNYRKKNKFLLICTNEKQSWVEAERRGE